MQIEEIKERLSELEAALKTSPVVDYGDIVVNERTFNVYLTQKLMKEARKSKVWRSKEFCITLRNLKYGLDPEQNKSRGGRDGVFLLDKTFRLYNEMQRIIFDRFIDKSNSGYSVLLMN